MSLSGYVFILTPIEPQVETPYQIIPKHFLQKAETEQIVNIKKLLKVFNTFPIPGIPDEYIQPPYEYDYIVTTGKQPGSTHYEQKTLPQDRWRYWVINFEGVNSELEELQYSLSLMDQDIELGFHFITGDELIGVSFGWHSQNLHTYFNDYDRKVIVPKIISSADLQLANECYSRLKQIPQQYSHINRAFHRFDVLRSIPLTSELTTIGLFSIIESLLTHAPSNNDPTDSLVRQIKHKIPLVRKRFRRTIDHNAIFNGIDEERLWVKLYAYRSKIVHGESADISGNLSVLKDRKTVIAYLRDIVKLLLIQSLGEPILMTDLKEC
ncbi:MAG: hypothetical protein ABSB91_03630 [Sedimentisphaerales bacterium]|jgi:hypothetical protein